jgi:DNA-binding transcriptional MerR regulator
LSSSATAPVPEEPEKDEGYYQIGDVSRLANVKPFVLRFWEEEFPMLQPFKSPSGRRLYRQEDVDLVLKIRRLLYDEGFTIAGARRFLLDTENGNAEPNANGDVPLPSAESPTAQLNRKMLLDLRDSLRSFLTLLERK